MDGVNVFSAQCMSVTETVLRLAGVLCNGVAQHKTEINTARQRLAESQPDYFDDQ